MSALQVHGTQRQILSLVSRSWSWLFLLILLIFFSISGQGFFSFYNLQNIVYNLSFVLLLAIGQTFVIILAGLDLSTGFMFGLSSVVSALVILGLGTHVPLPLAVLLSLLAGIAVCLLPGLLNGLIISRLSVPPFIVTLGMYGIARGAAFIIANGFPVSVSIPGVREIGNNYLLYIIPGRGVTFFQPPVGLTPAQMRSVTGVLPFELIICLAVLLFCYWLLARTKFGAHVYAIGGNREAARRAGIPVARTTLQVYLLSAALAGLAGVLYMFRFTSGSADAGDPMLIESIAAVAIGGASLFGGEGTITGTLIGVLIISVIQNGLVILGIDPFWQFITVGIVIIIAVFVDQLKARVLT